MAQTEDSRSVSNIDPEFLEEGPDTEYVEVGVGEEPPTTNRLTSAQLDELAAANKKSQDEAVTRAEERERVLKGLGDHFLILIPEGVKGIEYYMTRVSIDDNGAATIGRATIVAVLEKIVRDLKVMEEMDFQKQVIAQMTRNEQERQQTERAAPKARIFVPAQG